MKTKTIAGALALVALLSLFLIPGGVTEESEYTYLGEGNEAAIDSAEYATLAEAVADAQNNDIITLLTDVQLTSALEIPDTLTVTIDLNGCTITNADGEHTIINYGTLTITDTSASQEGTVDNTSHQKAALINYGSAYLNGGTFERSQEAGTYDPRASNSNTYYTVRNLNYMEIDGASIINDGGFSSCITNGYYFNGAVETSDDKTAAQAITGDVTPTLIIYSGTITGGLNTIKNDNSAVMYIYGGTFECSAKACVFNLGTLDIEDGSFIGNLYVIQTGSENDTGDITINGGEFYATAETAYMIYQDSTASYTGETASVSIASGTFDSSEASALVAVLYSTDEESITVTGGEFTAEIASEYIASTYSVEYNAVTGTYVASAVEPEIGEITYKIDGNSITASVTASGYDTLTWTVTDESGNVVAVSSTTTLTYTASQTGVYTFTATALSSNGTSVQATVDVDTTPYYTVTYTDGTDEAEESIREGSEITLPGAIFAKEGYTLSGWTDGTSEYATSDSYTVTGEVTFTALWTADIYEVTFITDGGSDIAAQNVAYGETAEVPEDPEKAGYTFAGWYADDTFETEYTFTELITGNTAIYAKWTPETYTITYADSYSGSSTHTVDVLYGEEFTTASSDIYSLSGYTFREWNTKADGSGTSYVANYAYTYPYVGNITLYAIWTADTYVITFDANGGETSPTTATTSSSIVLPTSGFTREGYILSGWEINGVTYELGATYEVTGTVTIYAVWTKTWNFTVDYGAGTLADGSSTEVLTVTDGTVLTLVVTETTDGASLDGYTLAYYLIDGTAYYEGDSYTVTSDVTAYAVWEAIPEAGTTDEPEENTSSSYDWKIAIAVILILIALIWIVRHYAK